MNEQIDASRNDQPATPPVILSDSNENCGTQIFEATRGLVSAAAKATIDKADHANPSDITVLFDGEPLSGCTTGDYHHEIDPEQTVGSARGIAQWNTVRPTHVSFDDQLKFVTSLQGSSMQRNPESSDGDHAQFSVQRSGREIRLAPDFYTTPASPRKGRREHDAALPSIREEFTGFSTPLSATTEY